jgi:hypothetical protein
MSYGVTWTTSSVFVRICGTCRSSGSAGTTVSTSSITKLPSGRRFVAVPAAKSLPEPLKSLDCLAKAVHVALLHVALIVTFTSVETLVDTVNGFDVDRNWTTLPTVVAFQPVRLAVSAPASTVTPVGGTKFADPSVWLLDASLLSVSLRRADVDVSPVRV